MANARLEKAKIILTHIRDIIQNHCNHVYDIVITNSSGEIKNEMTLKRYFSLNYSGNSEQKNFNVKDLLLGPIFSEFNIEVRRVYEYSARIFMLYPIKQLAALTDQQATQLLAMLKEDAAWLDGNMLVNKHAIKNSTPAKNKKLITQDDKLYANDIILYLPLFDYHQFYARKNNFNWNKLAAKFNEDLFYTSYELTDASINAHSWYKHANNYAVVNVRIAPLALISSIISNEKEDHPSLLNSSHVNYVRINTPIKLSAENIISVITNDHFYFVQQPLQKFIVNASPTPMTGPMHVIYQRLLNDFKKHCQKLNIRIRFETKATLALQLSKIIHYVFHHPESNIAKAWHLVDKRFINYCQSEFLEALRQNDLPMITKYVIATRANNLINQTREAFWSGKTSIFSLMLDDRYGLACVLHTTNFLSNISEWTLNNSSIYESPISKIVASQTGIALIDKQKFLRDKITAEGLNFKSHIWERRGISALFYLCHYQSGKLFLLKYPEFFKMIHVRTFAKKIERGQFGNKAAYECLLQSELGKTLFRQIMQTPHMLNEISCPLTLQILLNPVKMNGCKHYFEEDAIQEYFNFQEVLNCPCCKKPGDATRSLTELKNFIDALVKEMPELKGKRYFNVFNFKKALDNNEDVLLNDFLPQIKQAFRHGDPDDIYHEALIFLCGSQKGISILKQDPEWQSLLTDELLNDVYEKNISAGTSLLYWLNVSELGLSYLKSFARKITVSQATLTSENTKGLMQGTSISFFDRQPHLRVSARNPIISYNTHLVKLR